LNGRFNPTGPNNGYVSGSPIAPVAVERVDIVSDNDGRPTFDIEFGPGVVGIGVGVSGLLFLLDPVVGVVAAGGVEVRPVALSGVAFACALCLGAVVFLRRGRRLFGIAHAIFGVAWSGIAVGTVLRRGTVIVAAVLLVVVGSGFLVAQAREWY
jgi:hypothetical protein